MKKIYLTHLATYALGCVVMALTLELSLNTLQTIALGLTVGFAGTQILAAIYREQIMRAELRKAVKQTDWTKVN